MAPVPLRLGWPYVLILLSAVTGVVALFLWTMLVVVLILNTRRSLWDFTCATEHLHKHPRPCSFVSHTRLFRMTQMRTTEMAIVGMIYALPSRRDCRQALHFNFHRIPTRAGK